MVFTIYLLCTCIFFIWIYFLWSRRHFYKLAFQLPGPIGLPFIGLGLKMSDPEKFIPYIARTSPKYQSPFVTWMGTSCVLYVNDPETVETIFNSPHCTNKGDFYQFMAAAIGDGLFTSSSPRWNKHRKLINPAFSRQIINNFLPIFNAEADVLLDKLIKAAATENNQIEMYGIIKKNVLEAACQTTMGKKMNFQNDGSAIIFDAYNRLTEICMKRCLSPWLYPDLIYQFSSLCTVQQKVVKVLFSFIEKLLQYGNKFDVTKMQSAGKRQDAIHDEEGIKRKSKAIFVEQICNHVDEGQLTWNDVRDEANVIIAATFETTSTALYIVCLCLAMHPEYQDKLYSELVEIFPNNSRKNIDSIYNNVTNEQLERMSYTEMVIKESMRLFAPVPLVLRSASNNFSLRNGCMVPLGTQIAIDIFNLQRSEKVWGAKAGCFCPELHFGTNANMTHPFAFIPFTKGLRMCIGYRYAMMLMKVMLAKIFRNFYLSTEAKLEDLIVKGTISLKFRDYPLFNVKQR